MDSRKQIKIGTRGSKLALWQSHWVQCELSRHWPKLDIDIIPIKTTGDKILDNSLAEIGGKALFIKEIEEALLNGNIDLAVHSIKDMPAKLPQGLCLGAIPSRENPADVFVSLRKISFKDIPKKSKVGTGSIRRKCQLKKLRPDLQFIDMRGNVDTRLQKLKKEEVDALVLAKAGLTRLGIKDFFLDPLAIIPAVGQGALGIEVRADDKNILSLVDPLNDAKSHLCVSAERKFLEVMGGNCQVPLSCYAYFKESQIILDAFVSDLEGVHSIYHSAKAKPEEASRTAEELAHELLENGGREILNSLYFTSHIQ